MLLGATVAFGLLSELCVGDGAHVTTGWLSAQEAPRTPVSNITTRGQVRPNYIQIPDEPKRPLEEWQSFVRGLSTNEAEFQVVVNQGRVLTLQKDIAEAGKPSPLIAAGDPTVIDFELVGPRQIRVLGRRIGVTDLSIVSGDGQTFSMEVFVVADLTLLKARLRQTFPDALVELTQLREHVIVEGQARDSRQIAQIIQVVAAYMDSVQVTQTTTAQGAPTPIPGAVGASPYAPIAPRPLAPSAAPVDPAAQGAAGIPGDGQLPGEVLPESARPNTQVTFPSPQVINLLRVPGPQQVMLKVQVAELNRTALRQLGMSMLIQGSNFAHGTNVSGGMPQVGGGGGGGGGGAGGLSSLLGLINPLTTTATGFAVFDSGDFNFFIDALRQNQVFKVLAEPNLVAMNGHEATFLAGGEFPVPVPQAGTGGASTVTIEYKEFGVRLNFIPYILDTEVVRLAVSPEVSSLDFATGVTVLGTSVPGLNTRRTSTVVELNQGQTLAISGLLQVELNGSTNRIPYLGDIPYLGPMFSNNSTQTVEKELVVLVTPYLVEAMDPHEVPPLPGELVSEPNDLEFFFKGYIEDRSGLPYRATTAWDDSWLPPKRQSLETRYMCGPFGYSD